MIIDLYIVHRLCFFVAQKADALDVCRLSQNGNNCLISVISEKIQSYWPDYILISIYATLISNSCLSLQVQLTRHIIALAVQLC